MSSLATLAILASLASTEALPVPSINTGTIPRVQSFSDSNSQSTFYSSGTPLSPPVFNSQGLQKTLAYDSAFDAVPRESQQYYNSDPVMNAYLAPQLNYVRGGYPYFEPSFYDQAYGSPLGFPSFNPNWVMEQGTDGMMDASAISELSGDANQIQKMLAADNHDNTKPPQEEKKA
jgi:hypothetical protein